MEKIYSYQNVRKEREAYYKYTYEEMMREIGVKALPIQKKYETPIVTKLKLEVSDLSKKLIETIDFHEKEILTRRVIFLQSRIASMTCS